MRSFWKPERRSKAKRCTKQKLRLSRRQCREIVYRRERWHCERCNREVTLDCWPWEPQRAHVNERVPRSLGGSPYDPDNCELLCKNCHLPGGQHAPTAERMKALKRRA